MTADLPPAADPADFDSEQEATNRGVARATGILALGNIISRVLGLVREIVLANLFGAGAAINAFNVAILVPRNLYDLLIGGHVNGAIIPVLSEVDTIRGRDELWRLVSVLLSMITVVLAAMIVLLEVAAPLVVRVVGGGFDAYERGLAVDLLRITTPALIFMGLFAILSGALYALRRFAWPAFATAMFNTAIVVVALTFTPDPQARLLWQDGMTRLSVSRPDDGILIVAFGWLAGSIAYLLLQVPGLRDAKLRFTLRWRHAGIRRIGLLYVPVMFSLVLDTLVVRLFSYNLASRSTIDGAIGIMNWATTLIQFPQGLVATAISIAVLPTLSRQAALIASDGEDGRNRRAFRDTLGLGMRLAITLILPAAVGLFALATPIVALIFQHGAFDASATESTSIALRLYLVGLPFAAVDLLLVYAFYARQDTFTPAMIGLFSLSLYMAVAIVLFPRMGLYSLMVADSAKHVTHAAISAFLLHRRMDGLSDRRLFVTASKTALAAGLMGITAALALPVVRDTVGSGGFLRELQLVGAAGGLSVAVFAIAAYLLNIEEWGWLSGLLRRRIAPD